MYLSIGGIYLKIKSKNDEFMRKTAQEFREFVLEEETKDCFLIKVDHGYIPQEVPSINVIAKESIFEISADEFRGYINREEKTAKVYIADLAGVFNCFLRVFYSVVLIDVQGFLVHSAGLAFQGKGYLFAGASESGKTTAATMAKSDYTILSDELVIIRQVNNDFFLFSTPFNGEFETPILSHCVPLQTIAFLNKNIKNGFSRLPRIEMFAELMTNIFFFLRDFKSNQSLIDQVNKVCAKVNGFRVDLFNYDIRRVIDGISENNSSKQSGSLAAS